MAYVHHSGSVIPDHQMTTIFQRLAALWTILITVVLFALFHERGFDDPFITYRYAENLAQGNGFVYNQGERVLSTTAPLYALILAGFGLLGLDIPLVSNALGCVSLAVGGYTFWRFGQIWKAPVVGTIGLMLYPMFPLLIPTLGAETSVYVTLILLGILAYAEQRYILATVWLALATLARADGAVAAVTLGIHFLLIRREPLPWRSIGLYVGLLLPWFTFAWIYFGAPLPVTLAAKQGQGLMAISQSFFKGLGTQALVYWNVPLYRLHVVLAVVGLGYALWKERSWLLLLAWNALYVVAYTVLGVTSYYWYYGPLAVGVVVLVALGIAACGNMVSDTRWSTLLLVMLVSVALIPQIQSINALRQTNDPRMTIYRSTGEWLRTNTPPTASVGTLEVGIIGYYAERRMIDFAGLIQPEIASRFRSDTTFEDGALHALHHYHPDYLVLQEGLFPRVENDSIYQSACQPLHSFTHESYHTRLVIHQCDWQHDS